jgi:NAD-dependent dihydropyrimidine dehydrogenase PreA subunit
MPPKVDQAKCEGAGECSEVCPADPKVFEIRDGKAYVVNPDECIECGACETACPVGAIELE